MIFSIDPIGKDETKLFKFSSVELQPGITILVGCNGSGKTTLLDRLNYQINHTDADDISSRYFLCCDTHREIDKLLFQMFNDEFFPSPFFLTGVNHKQNHIHLV